MVWGVGVGSGCVLVYAVCCPTVGARARACVCVCVCVCACVVYAIRCLFLNLTGYTHLVFAFRSVTIFGTRGSNHVTENITMSVTQTQFNKRRKSNGVCRRPRATGTGNWKESCTSGANKYRYETWPTWCVLPVLCCAVVWYDMICFLLFPIVLFFAFLCFSLLFCAVLCCILLCHAVLCCVVLCCVLMRCFVLCCSVFCCVACAVLCCSALWHDVLCYLWCVLLWCFACAPDVMCFAVLCDVFLMW